MDQVLVNKKLLDYQTIQLCNIIEFVTFASTGSVVDYHWQNGDSKILIEVALMVVSMLMILEVSPHQQGNFVGSNNPSNVKIIIL